MKKLVLPLAMVLLLAGCSAKKEAEKEPEAVRSVQVAEVTRGPIARVIQAEGILRALDQSAVTAKISAPVARFLVNRGDHVTKGQLLAVLENRDLAAAVTDAKGAVDQAESGLRNITNGTVPEDLIKARSDVEAAKQTMDAAQKLVDSRQQLFTDGAIARRLVDEAGVAFAQAKSQYDTARQHLASVEGVSRVENVKSAAGQVDSTKGKYDAAWANLSYSEIYSPINGVVADRPVFPGELAVPGTPLVNLIDISSVIARVNVPQAQARYIHVGQSARMVAPDGTEAPGKVTVISPSLDPQGTTLEVWVQAANPGEKLRPGGTVHVTLSAETVPNAILVPLSALLPSAEGGSSVVVVGPDMTAHQHKVEVGIRSADKAQVLEGVEAGAKVVVEGGLGLEDGAKVKIAESGEKNEK